MALLKPDFWLKLLEKHGFSTLFALLLFFYVLLPMVEGHLKFLDRVAASVEKTAESGVVLATSVKGVDATMKRVESKLDLIVGQKPE